MQFLDVVFEVEAHDAEVLCIEYSSEYEGKRPLILCPTSTFLSPSLYSSLLPHFSLSSSKGLQFMASASRDRLIHVFSVGDTYRHMQTMDDHSASITAIRFTGEGERETLTCVPLIHQ